MKTRAPRTSSLLGPTQPRTLFPFNLFPFSPRASARSLPHPAFPPSRRLSLPHPDPPPSTSRHLSSPALPFLTCSLPIHLFSASATCVCLLVSIICLALPVVPGCPGRLLLWRLLCMLISSPSLFSIFSLASPCVLAQPAAQLPLVLHLVYFFSTLARTRERQLSHATIPHPCSPPLCLPACRLPPTAFACSKPRLLPHPHYYCPLILFAPLLSFAVSPQIPNSRDRPETGLLLPSIQPNLRDAESQASRLALFLFHYQFASFASCFIAIAIAPTPLTSLCTLFPNKAGAPYH